MFEHLQDQLRTLFSLKPSAKGPIFYFAYGSNLDWTEMKKRCPGAKTVQSGRLPQYRLDFTHDAAGFEGGVADVVPDPEWDVWGMIYELTKEDLKILDKYEDCPRAYYRFLTNIECSNSTMKNVWVYSVAEKHGFVAPADKYLQWIRKAAAELEFPEDYQIYLRSVPTQVDGKEREIGS